MSFVCTACNDLRWVVYPKRGHAASPCPRCGELDSAAYLKFLAENGTLRVGITELDLTDKELKTYRRWRLGHPLAGKRRVLAWIEGSRCGEKERSEWALEYIEYRSAHERAVTEKLPLHEPCWYLQMKDGKAADLSDQQQRIGAGWIALENALMWEDEDG